MKTNKQALGIVIILLFSHFVTIAQTKTSYKPVEKSKLDQWVKTARKRGEIDSSKLQKLDEEYEFVKEHPDNINAVFDYARILTIVVQPGLSYAIEKELSVDAKYLVEESEKAYLSVLLKNSNHGRANIMLGTLYNQQGKYSIATSFLEKGMELPEGSADWMIAANQYLLGGAESKQAHEDNYQTVYKLFKKQVPLITRNKAYYQKMAKLYVSYYE